MTRSWYGNAQSAKQAPRTHAGNKALKAVAGMASKSTMRSMNVDPSGVRAIYGSTDNAQHDHSNDTLCVLAPTGTVFTSNPTYRGSTYTPDTHRYAYHEPTSTPAPEPMDIDLLVRRAIKRGMTLVAYCAALGISLDS